MINGAEILDSNGDRATRELSVRLGYGDPKAFLFKEPVLAELCADICCSCGTTNIRVKNPTEAWANYQALPAQAPDTKDPEAQEHTTAGGLSMSEGSDGRLSKAEEDDS